MLSLAQVHKLISAYMGVCNRSWLILQCLRQGEVEEWTKKFRLLFFFLVNKIKFHPMPVVNALHIHHFKASYLRMIEEEEACV